MTVTTDTVSSNAVISARGLDLTFQTNDGPIHALKDINLDIGRGEFVSFIGPSGCGKTTFLRVIADLEAPTAGEVTVNGMRPAEARRNRAYGYVFQAAGLYPWRTISAAISDYLLKSWDIPRLEHGRLVWHVRFWNWSSLTGFGRKVPLATVGGDAATRLDCARAGL